MKLLIMLLFLISCGKPVDGIDGSSGTNGSDGLTLVSIDNHVSVQEIIGDGITSEFNADTGMFLILPEIESLNVDNSKPHCDQQEAILTFETDSGLVVYTFESVSRYRMELKSLTGGETGKSIRTESVKILFEKRPSAICEDGIYEFHSGVSFNMITMNEV